MKSESDAHDIYNKAWDLPLNSVGIYAMRGEYHHFMLITIDLQAKSCENTLRMLKKSSEATRTFDKNQDWVSEWDYLSSAVAVLIFYERQLKNSHI